MQAVEALPAMPTVPTREQIERLEFAMARHPGRIELEPKHYFAEGLYAREVHIPAGVCVTGKVHKRQHLVTISTGDVTVWTEQGMQRLKAPAIFVSHPGAKRAAFAHEDTVFTTFHANPTEERDVEKVEALFVEPIDPALAEALKCLT